MKVISLNQTSSNNFRVTKNILTGNTTNLYLYKYDAVPSSLPLTPHYTLSNVLGVFVDITIPEDGMYVLIVNDSYFDTHDLNNVTITATINPIYLTIPVMAKLNSCIESLTDKLLCKDDCLPCENCNEEHYLREFQYKLNKMSLLFFVVLGYINWEKVEYYNNYYWTSDRATQVLKIGLMFDKINLITSCCNEC